MASERLNEIGSSDEVFKRIEMYSFAKSFRNFCEFHLASGCFWNGLLESEIHKLASYEWLLAVAPIEQQQDNTDRRYAKPSIWYTHLFERRFSSKP